MKTFKDLFVNDKIIEEYSNEVITLIDDTYHAWMPKHDHPVSMQKWKKMLNNLSIEKKFDAINVFECGQGNAAILKKL